MSYAHNLAAQSSREPVTPITAEIPLQASNDYSRNFCGVHFDNPFVT